MRRNYFGGSENEEEEKDCDMDYVGWQMTVETGVDARNEGRQNCFQNTLIMLHYCCVAI